MTLLLPRGGTASATGKQNQPCAALAKPTRPSHHARAGDPFLPPPPGRRGVAAAAFLEGIFGKKPGAPTPQPPPPSSSSAPGPRFPPPTPAPDGSLPPPPPEVTSLGLPHLCVACTEPLTLGSDSSPPTHALLFASGPATLTAPALGALTDAVGWPPRDTGRVAAALAGSYYTAAVLLAPLNGGDNGGGGGGSDPPPSSIPPSSILVGAARATSDAAFNATLWDVLVHPAVQGRGVGAALVERVTGDLLRAGLGNVTLFSGRDSVGFYSGLGYEADPEGIKGMFHVGL